MQFSRPVFIGVSLALFVLLASGAGVLWYTGESDHTSVVTGNQPVPNNATGTPVAPGAVEEVPQSVFPLYHGVPVAALKADPSIVAQVPDHLTRTKNELADLALKLAVDPGQPELWKRVASLKHFFNDDEGARDAYEYVNTIAPQDAVAFYNLALIYGYNLKDPAKALPKFEQALRLNPLTPNFYVGFAHFYQEVMHDFGAAKRVLRTAYESIPSDPAIITSLALIAKAQGDIQGAITYYEEALRGGDLSSGERQAIEAEVKALRAKL